MITVVMPVYNGKLYIDEQIKSILDQNVSLKLIVLDDCSSDGSYEYLLSTYAGYSNITILKNEYNLGVIKSVEKLLGMVDTAYFALADQDDVWLKGKLQDSLNVLSQSDADLVYTDLSVVDEELNVTHQSKWVFSNTSPFSGCDPLPFVIKNPVTGCTVVGHRRMLQSALPFPEGIPMHDRWLAVAACAGKGVTFLDKPTMLYRQHGNNEVGGMPYGFMGLLARVKKDAKGSLSDYLSNRISRRMLLLYAMRPTVNPEFRGDLEFLIHYYKSSWFKRVLFLGKYKCIISRYKKMGLKNIYSDMLMNIIPVFSKRKVQGERDGKT